MPVIDQPVALDDIYPGMDSNATVTLGTVNTAGGTQTAATVTTLTSTTSTITTANITTANITTANITNAPVVTGLKYVHIQKYQYDFADFGGGTGTITLKDDANATQTVPDNSIVTRSWVEPITDNTTGGGNATVKVEIDDGSTQTELLAATAFDNTIFTGDTITAGSNLPVKVAAATSVKVVIATADLTAGLFNVYVEYYLGSAT